MRMVPGPRIDSSAASCFAARRGGRSGPAAPALALALLAAALAPRAAGLRPRVAARAATSAPEADAELPLNLLVFETRPELAAGNRLRSLERAGRVEVVGLGEAWHGFETKVSSLVSHIDNGTDPEGLLILIDSEACFGGCGGGSSSGGGGGAGGGGGGGDGPRRTYAKLRAASGGAPVVVSGNLHQWPAFDGAEEGFEKLEPRRRGVLAAFGLPGARRSGGDGAAWSDGYRYVNAGFMMGPRKKLIEVLSCMKDRGRDSACSSPFAWFSWAWYHKNCKTWSSEPVFDDQLALARCAVERPDLVAIDYAGALVLSTHGAPREALRFVGAEGRSIRNEATGLTQCFIHNSGLGLAGTKREWGAFNAQCRAS